MLLESRIKRKREKAAIPQMRKFKLFFFRFSSDAPSEPTHSISSFFYFFFSMLAAAALYRRRRRHCTASVKRHHFLYQLHMRARANAVLYCYRRRQYAVARRLAVLGPLGLGRLFIGAIAGHLAHHLQIQQAWGLRIPQVAD